MTRVFIDGGAGTTGLEIADRLADRGDISRVTLPDHARKDPAARADALRSSDIVILCLPDDAAREAVALIGDAPTRIIDASTAHRTAAGWTYGFAELEPGRRAALAASARVSNPGCYPTGYLALVRPLVRAGLLPADWPVTVNAVSGYSGGGKAMIAEFEADPPAADTAYRAYALNLGHKHVTEMRDHAGQSRPPIFTPAVARTYRGMLVEVPIHADALGTWRAADVRDLLHETYRHDPLVGLGSAEVAALAIEQCAGTDRIELFAFGDGERVRLIAALDNLGKGAGGAAVQNLNLMAGLVETAGLRL